MSITEDFIKSLSYSRISVDFSNEWVDENIVLLSKEDIKVDSEGNEIVFFEGLEIFAYEENYEWGGTLRDDIIANGVCEKNRTGFAPVCKWVMRIDCNGIHYMSDFKKG